MKTTTISETAKLVEFYATSMATAAKQEHRSGYGKKYRAATVRLGSMCLARSLLKDFLSK